MTSRLGRFLAPIALVTSVIAVLVTVQVSLTDEQRPSGADREQEAGRTEERSEARSPSRSKGPRTYTVRRGDVLSVIAERNGVTVDRLIELNPDVDTQNLRVGQRLRLRR
jgi:LysM repeat protein